jgi:type I restriction enzyme M protein
MNVKETKAFKQKTLSGESATAKKKVTKKKDSEYQSYTYIRNEIKDKGWSVTNPNRDPIGQLYTQNECLQNPEIASKWNKAHPEYLIKLSEDAFWVIEAKPNLADLDKAFDEAKWYGKLLNEHSFVRALIVTGVAGNDIDKYLLRSGFWIEAEKEYKTITYEQKEITSILTPELAGRLLSEKNPAIKEFDISNDDLLKAADKINQTFQKASIPKESRATIVATMLLSLLGETEPNYNARPEVFINDINVRAKDVLKNNSKEGFFNYLEMELPKEPDAQSKYKEALVLAFFTLRKINIKAAMRTGSDILGRFYETFLKYGNGAKDLGIVLTPRHVTEFASEILNITHNDFVYDPTCGTAGFLVSSFYHVKRNSTPEQLDAFRLHRIYGIDQQSKVAALAIVNMIFRGDGSTHILNDNCLARGLIKTLENNETSAKFVSRDTVGTRIITKVLMNPPFGLEESTERDFRFIEHALNQMDNGGLLFCVLPCSSMVKAGEFKKWRIALLNDNTLLSAITFVPDLFYPQSQPPSLAIILRKGVKHPLEQQVLWIRITNDGYRKVKGKRLKNEKVSDSGEMTILQPMIKGFIADPKVQVTNEPEIKKASSIDYSDKDSFELIPEAYIEAKIPSDKDIHLETDNVMRELIAFLIRTRKEELIS